MPQFQKIKYADLYPGVDLVYYGNQETLEYDLIVAPGASWRSIRLSFSREQGVGIDHGGGLRYRAGFEGILHSRPMIYQRDGNSVRQIPGRYVFISPTEVGLEIGSYDPRLPLVIDPTLTYASYLGGSGDDYGHAIAIDSSGCAYVVGETQSADFPRALPEQANIAGNSDIFITKWNAAGTGIVYSTYIGGTKRDVALGVAVDSSGNAYIAGFTYSGDFPVTSGALRRSFVGNSKSFVVRLNSAGNQLTYATYLGGSGDDYGTGIAVDASGQAHVSGYTSSLDFPVSSGAFQRSFGGGPYDGFLAKVNAAGSALVYATYLGGTGNDTAAGVVVDASGNIYVTGQTQSANFPTINPVQAVNAETDAFVVKLNVSGTASYSTYLGGTGLNYGTGIAADAAGNAYVTGYTNASDFPITANAYQKAIGSSYDAFAAVINSYGSSITAATYLGGSGSDVSYGIALDSGGNVFVTGSTTSMDFPVQGSIQPAYQGGGDAFVAALNNQLSTLLYATYFGGSQSDVGAGIAVDPSGNAYITGWTNSGNSSAGLPIPPGAFQPVGRGGEDAYIAKLSFTGSALTCGTSVPKVLTVQAGSSAQLVGDLLLSCTGGTVGSQASATIQVALNANLASTSQAELFIGTSTNPVWGITIGSAVQFIGVSFAAPGPSSSITLRITNVWADVSALAAGTQVIMTATASNANPAITIAPAQQEVALVQVVTTPQLQQAVLSKASTPPANCAAPSPASSFLLTDTQALAWILVTNTSSGDVGRMDWISPSGSKYQSHSYTVNGGGTQCLSDLMTIARANASMPGAWSVNIYWNNTQLGSVPFSISVTGAKDLIWQNLTTRQTNGNFYAAGSATMIGWAVLNSGASGWRVVGAADFNKDGVTDLVWQNISTGQVNVNYYGGAGGTTITGTATLNSGAGTAGWSVVAVADINADGVPDLIWQNSSTGQVNVNYYGGTGGATMTGWAVLNSGAGTSGWHVVAAADFDGNGNADLVWQNRTTGQVNVNYYGGTNGATLTGFAVLNSGAGTAGWSVMAAADFDGNGVPDLIWQCASTGQVNVNYYGGKGGATLTGFAVLNSGAGTSGWQAVTAH